MASINTKQSKKRSMKPKIQYSPSNPPITSVFHLINYDDTRTMMIVANSSIKKRVGEDMVILNDNRAAKLIISGTKEKCLEQWNKQRNFSQIDDDNERNDYDASSDVEPTLQMPKKTFSTPDPFRRNNVLVNRSISPDASYLLPSPKRFANENQSDRVTKYTTNGSSITRGPIAAHRVISSSSDEEEIVDESDKVSFNRIIQELRNAQTVLQESSAENRAVLNKLTKKVAELRPSVLMKKDLNLDRYRNANDQEIFRKEIMFEGQNLLDIAARNPGEYSRMLLRTLFQPHELETSLLPSPYAKRFSKPQLDSERFNLLNEAVRCRYRISKENYGNFYKEIIQETLATCLYNDGPRKKRREIIQQQLTSSTEQQPIPPNVSATTNDEEKDDED